MGIEDFADPTKRSQWIKDKGLTVFSLSSARHPATEIDLFVECPVDFEGAYARASRQEVEPGVPAIFLGLDEKIEGES